MSKLPYAEKAIEAFFNHQPWETQYRAVTLVRDNPQYLASLNAELSEEQLQGNLCLLGAESCLPGETFQQRLTRYSSHVKFLTDFVDKAIKVSCCTASFNHNLCSTCRNVRYTRLPCVQLPSLPFDSILNGSINVLVNNAE